MNLICLLGDLHAHIAFGALHNFVISVLLGTLYIDRFIAGIFLLERQIVPVNSREVAILASYSSEQVKNGMVTNYADRDNNYGRLPNNQEAEQTYN